MEVLSVQKMPSSTYEPKDDDVYAEFDRICKAGIYWVLIGDSRSKKHHHSIKFEDDILIVNGQNRGKALDPSNQSFLQSLERYELPAEFHTDGTHSLMIERRGDKAPVQFKGKYFMDMSENYEFDSGGEDEDVASDYYPDYSSDEYGD